jgi:hypothetical protein
MRNVSFEVHGPNIGHVLLFAYGVLFHNSIMKNACQNVFLWDDSLCVYYEAIKTPAKILG